AQDKEFHFIELTPKTQTVSLWGRILLVVSRKDELPVREEYYDEKNNKVRVLEFKDVKILSGRKMPATMELTSIGKKKNKTIIRYVKADFNIKLSDDTFTQRNLTRQR
ncbi:MAG: outer membrane lipoprotein-sorting protein, partial [Oligoflexales bacterium]|nr:outer membrane lipoprotein-sorting protein [Oligoflexales bacterium]